MWTCSSKLPFEQAPHGDGVVEVARRLAVDGHDGQRAKVAAVAAVWPARNHSVELLRLLQDLDRKVVRQVEFADDDLDIDAEIVFVAKNFHHPSARVFGGRGPVRDLDFDHHAFQIAPLPLPRLFAQHPIPLRVGAPSFRPFHPSRNHDLLRDLLVDGRNVVLPRPAMKCPHHRRISASEHAQNSAFRPAIIFLADKLHQHLIAVHRGANRRRRNKYVARDLLGAPPLSPTFGERLGRRRVHHPSARFW